MPNWCNNHITIRHADKAKIDAIMATEGTDQGILDLIVPCPPELNDQDLTTYGGGDDEQARREIKQAEMVRKYGYKSWYEWNTANWGTKWDLCEPTLTRVDDNTVTIACDTAWGPPVAAYQNMEAQGYEVKAYYFEGGMCFAGIYENGDDSYWQNWGDSQGAKDTLPEDLDEMFAISESQAEWEEEERREEELYRFVKDGADAKATANQEVYHDED